MSRRRSTRQLASALLKRGQSNLRAVCLTSVASLGAVAPRQNPDDHLCSPTPRASVQIYYQGHAVMASRVQEDTTTCHSRHVRTKGARRQHLQAQVKRWRRPTRSMTCALAWELRGSGNKRHGLPSRLLARLLDPSWRRRRDGKRAIPMAKERLLGIHDRHAFRNYVGRRSGSEA